jgi:hypothetical protein
MVYTGSPFNRLPVFLFCELSGGVELQSSEGPYPQTGSRSGCRCESHLMIESGKSGFWDNISRKYRCIPVAIIRCRVPDFWLPMMAPWENELEMWAFVQRMRPQVVIPIHDGQAKPFFIDHRYEILAEEFDKDGIHFINLKGSGDSYECAHA